MLLADALATSEAARLLAVSPARVRAMVAAGQLPVARRVGRNLLLDGAAVRALAAERAERPPRTGPPKGDPRAVAAGRRGGLLRWSRERAAA